MSPVGLYGHQNCSPEMPAFPLDVAVYGSTSPTPDVSFPSNLPHVCPTQTNPGDSNPLAVLAASAADPTAGPHVKALFPSSPSESRSQPVPTKRRIPSGKRLSQGYIPRPQNPFMLFRADFVKKRHVPGSVETNNHSLSKIIGNHWRSLTPEERRVWEVKAKLEKAAHKIRFPEYRFRPIHNKHKKSQMSTTSYASSSYPESHDYKRQMREEEMRRCDDVAQLLLEGKNGEELVRAMKDLDRARRLQRFYQPQLDIDLDFDEYASDPTSGSRGTTPNTMTPPLQHTTLQHLPFGPRPHADIISRHRRASSAPQPSVQLIYPSARGIALPTLPPVISRPSSPSVIPSISRFGQCKKDASPALQHPLQDRYMDSFQQPTSYHNPLSPPLVGFPQPLTPQAFLPDGFVTPSPKADTLGADHVLGSAQPEGALGLGHRRRSITMPAMTQNSFMQSSLDDTSFDLNMAITCTQVAMEMRREVEPQFFGNISFNGNTYVESSSETPAQESLNSSSFSRPTPDSYDQGADGTINPASLMRLPAASASAAKLTPIDTSVYSLPHSYSSSYPSESFSSTSSHSTPVMTPSSAFPSPAPLSSSISSYDADVDIADSLSKDYMQLDAFYPRDAVADGMIFSDDGFYGVEGVGMCGYDLNADAVTISPQRWEECALYSKMVDMPTPTQATFGMVSI